MSNLDGCQLPNIPRFACGRAVLVETSLLKRIKRLLAVPWNYHAKKWLKRAYHTSVRLRRVPSRQPSVDPVRAVPLKTGDLVRVRPREEIQATLDPFKELKGCAFLPDMYQYCGTQHRVLKSMKQFIDERDYKVKKTRGVILLENVICSGTPAFGACDRCCFLFWREEWLEKLD